MGYTPLSCFLTTQRQYGRKTVPSPEQLAPRPMPGLSQRPWPIVGCSLAACLLIGLVYFLQSSIFLVPLILPGRHHQNIQEHEAITARPRIELHPQDHVHRPAATQYLDWRVTSGFRRPDGVLKRVYLING